MSSELTIAFDADDTLWHNEDSFAAAEHRFNELVAPWANAEVAQEKLVAFERSHLDAFGYGVKSFALSMVAAACDISENQISAAQLRTIVDTATELLTTPTIMIDGARQAMKAVAELHPAMVITKGDLHHQLRRINEVGIASLCFDVEVVADKDAATYRRILARHQIDPERFVMIGNSIVSDIAPLLELGAMAIHIPYEVTWALETATADPPPSDRWFRLDSISDVPALIESLA